MRFRSFLTSVAVVAVAFAGSLGLAGAAEAAAPVAAPAVAPVVPVRVLHCGGGVGTVSGSTCTLPGGRTCTVATGATSCSVFLRGRFGGGLFGGRFGGGLYGGRFGGLYGGLYGGGYGYGNRFGGLYQGRFLPLAGGVNFDVCQYPSWSAVVRRQAFRRAAIQARLGQGDFATLYAQLVAQADC